MNNILQHSKFFVIIFGMNSLPSYTTKISDEPPCPHPSVCILRRTQVGFDLFENDFLCASASKFLSTIKNPYNSFNIDFYPHPSGYYEPPSPSDDVEEPVVPVLDVHATDDKFDLQFDFPSFADALPVDGNVVGVELRFARSWRCESVKDCQCKCAGRGFPRFACAKSLCS